MRKILFMILAVALMALVQVSDLNLISKQSSDLVLSLEENEANAQFYPCGYDWNRNILWLCEDNVGHGESDSGNSGGSSGGGGTSGWTKASSFCGTSQIICNGVTVIVDNYQLVCERGGSSSSCTSKSCQPLSSCGQVPPNPMTDGGGECDGDCGDGG